MTNDGPGDDRDPLLVRRFLLGDVGAPGDDPSTQTWPAATTREVRSAHASADDAPTAVLPLARVSHASPSRHRRRLVVLGCVVVAVVAGATVASYAALRPGMRPPVSAAMPGSSPLPVVTGPKAPAPAAPATTASSRRPQHSATVAATTGPATTVPTGAHHGASAADSHTTTAPAAPTQLYAPILARVGAIRGENGLCLDLAGGVPADGVAVLVSPCKGTDTQRWTMATDGTLRVADLCALGAGDDTVQVASCDGGATAQWHVSGSALVAAGGACLTDPAGGAAPGTTVTVTDCTGAENQQWSLP